VELVPHTRITSFVKAKNALELPDQSTIISSVSDDPVEQLSLQSASDQESDHSEGVSNLKCDHMLATDIMCLQAKRRDRRLS